MNDEAPPKKWRANYVPAPHFFNLNHACTLINAAFGGFGCYLVGSALEHKDHRDVDVRFIMPDEEYDKLFKNEHGWLNPRWSLFCVMISEWLGKQSGLPVDFQFQRQTQANEVHPGAARRHPLGVFLDYPEERPSDIAPEEKKDGEAP